MDQFSRVLDGDANDGSNNSATFNYTWLMNHQLNSTGVNNPLFQYVPQTGTVSYGTANADNGLTTITASSGSATMSYDGNLNLTYDGVNTLTYDVENRLIAAQNTAWGASTYLYDPLGQRKQKVVGVNTAMPVATDFVLAGGAEIADYYETSATWRLTVRGVGGLPLVTVVPGGAGSEEIVYVHHDLKGSTVALTEAGSNGPAESYTYSDYGAPQSGSWLAYQYAGYRYDSETGLYYMPARSYSPTLGRFLQSDPSGFGGGFNLYAYAGNDPINLTDSTGQSPDGGGYTVTLSLSVATPFMAVLGVPQITVSATATVCPFYCNAEFIKASNQAWMRAKNGSIPGEATVWITGSYLSPIFTPGPWTNESNTATKLAIPPGAIGLIHTHPNERKASPSGKDIAYSNSSGLPFYVLSNRGLWLANANSPNPPQMLRPDTSWLNPCK